MPSGKTLIIGGGIIGAACAYYLRRDGRDVEIIDQGAFGKGCSHGNCGLVTPSHVLPLTTPGAIGMALKSLFKKNAPFRVKPSLNLELLSWMAKFARRCNVRDMLQAGSAIQALLQSSRPLYETLLDEEGIDCEWDPRGLFFVLQSQPGMAHFAETDQLLREHFRVGGERYDGDALAAIEPALKPGLAGGWLYRCDAMVRPDRLMAGLRQVLERHGVVIREQCKLQALDRRGTRVVRAITSQGPMEAEQFIVATGAWTPLLNEQLGCKIPIQPGKGYSITMPRPARCPAYPMLFEEHRVAVTPFRSGYRLGSTMEFAGYDATLNRVRLDYLKEGARPYLHEPYGEVVQEEWYGWRPMTPDSVPIIDQPRGLENVWLAVGHNMLGLSMAPATGKLVAELAARRQPHVDPAPYSFRRFA